MIDIYSYILELNLFKFLKFFLCINQANWAISTDQPHTLRCLHIQPINVVFHYRSIGGTSFEVSFPLRSFQRLSFTYLATQHFGWRHNWSISDMFIRSLASIILRHLKNEWIQAVNKKLYSFCAVFIFNSYNFCIFLIIIFSVILKDF